MDGTIQFLTQVKWNRICVDLYNCLKVVTNEKGEAVGEVVTITVKGGNFVTFFAQINFFLKNALR
jgi:hypothetical protein